MTDETRRNVLAVHLGVHEDDLESSGAGVFEYGRQEWLVLDDSEADDRAEHEIRNSLWAFHAEFIRAHSKALRTDGAVKALEKMRAELCEDAGPLVEAMIDDMDHFINDAIKADGRGHFISMYDGEEVEARWNEGRTTFYLYRLN